MPDTAGMTTRDFTAILNLLRETSPWYRRCSPLLTG